MGDSGGGGAGAGLLSFIMLFIIGYLAWLTFIGPDDPNSKNLFICPPPPLGNGHTYNLSDIKKNTYEKICGSISTKSSIKSAPPRPIVTSVEMPGIVKKQKKTKKVVKIEHLSAAAKDARANREYISIYADLGNTEAIDVTGWKIGSAVTQNSFEIPQAELIPTPGRTGGKTDIILAPGDRIVLATGHSPVATSFKVNICSGYLDQYQQFYPSINRSCPVLRDQIRATPDVIQSFGDECISIINHIGKCKSNSGALPQPRYPAACQSFIHEKANYNGCVEDYKDSPKFFEHEWRVFLERDQEIWRSNYETIHLYDQNGAIVSTLTY